MCFLKAINKHDMPNNAEISKIQIESTKKKITIQIVKMRTPINMLNRFNFNLYAMPNRIILITHNRIKQAPKEITAPCKPKAFVKKYPAITLIPDAIKVLIVINPLFFSAIKIVPEKPANAFAATPIIVAGTKPNAEEYCASIKNGKINLTARHTIPVP